MKFLFTLLSPSLYLDLPQGVIGWVGWLVQLCVIGLLAWHWQRTYRRAWQKRERLLFLLLTVLTVVTALFLGIELPAGNAQPLPGRPVEPQRAIVMIFSAVPWALAAGMLGPAAAVVLGLLSGILQALWDTHSLFTPLEVSLLALLLSAAVQQRYRTRTYRLLRHPLIAAIPLALLYMALALFNGALLGVGSTASRLDYGISSALELGTAMALELLVAAIFAEALAASLPNLWVRPSRLTPSPAERSLQARFLYGLAPLAGALIFVLIVGDWVVATNAANEMLQGRMSNAANMAAQNVPYFLETGQNLITRLAGSPTLPDTTDEAELSEYLSGEMRQVPFFRQLYLLSASENPVAGYPTLAAYPAGDYQQARPPVGEQRGVALALTGVPVQTFTVPPVEGETSAQISFVAPVVGANGEITRVLVGRTDLTTNPFTQPILSSLNNLNDLEGEGLLIDENGQILYHPNPTSENILSLYRGEQPGESQFYDETGPDGTRLMVYYQPAVGRPWAVVLRVPARQTQNLALRIAAPLLGMIIVLSLLSLIILRLGLQMVTASLQSLAQEAGYISQGQLDTPLPVDGEDEVGQLRRAFEHMRLGLKARMDELNRLLVVSQGVASSLEVGEAVRPVLDSALGTGACAARVVLSASVVPELDGQMSTPSSFSAGPAADHFSYLDDQILSFTRTQDRLALSSPSRTRLLQFPGNRPRPESLLAVALRHESLYYGTLWVAYDEPHTFSEEEVRFMTTLASQAALAAANARLFLNAEIGRQRLAAILASTPDPVLVTDQNDRLLLANPASWQALGLGIEAGEGQPIERVIPQKELVELLRSVHLSEGGADHSAGEKKSIEVTLNDQVFLATASSVMAEGRRVGRVCVLRDVTHFKELDALKSEFVSTVSHDLRSPLTLMRGYATMLEMVGQLNEQQAGYVRKIVGGVESMSRLVNNLLDLGRIEAGIGLQLEMVPVQDVLERVVGALQLQASQKHIQLGYEIKSNTAALIEADQALLQQALQNLIENAIKYTRNEGKVQVRVESREDRLTFEVQDTGIGISPMDQPRLFERFYRGAQQASREQRGTGLGLAIVKSITERHGGQVWVESQLGKGSTFYLTLPLRQTEPDYELAA